MLQDLKPATIHISYDPNLQKITGKATEVSMVNDGILFIQFLYFLFESYPEIQTTYPPGTLGFSVNGKPPRDGATLHDGDKLIFVATPVGKSDNPWVFKSTRPTS